MQRNVMIANVNNNDVMVTNDVATMANAVKSVSAGGGSNINQWRQLASPAATGVIGKRNGHLAASKLTQPSDSY